MAKALGESTLALNTPVTLSFSRGSLSRAFSICFGEKIIGSLGTSIGEDVAYLRALDAKL